MFKKGQIVNLKNVFIISLVLIVLVAGVLFFNGTTGFAIFKKESQVTYQGMLDILSNSKVINPYGSKGSAVGQFLADGKTPNQFCKEKGYGNCIFVINYVSEVHFNSKDLTCSGDVHYVDNTNALNSQADCNTLFNENFYRNTIYDPRPKPAKCMGGGYGNTDYWENYDVNFICVNP